MFHHTLGNATEYFTYMHVVDFFFHKNFLLICKKACKFVTISLKYSRKPSYKTTSLICHAFQRMLVLSLFSLKYFLSDFLSLLFKKKFIFCFQITTLKMLYHLNIVAKYVFSSIVLNLGYFFIWNSFHSFLSNNLFSAFKMQR